MVVIILLVMGVRELYVRRAEVSGTYQRAFVYGLLYVRTVALLGCAGGLVMLWILYEWRTQGFSYHLSLVGTIVFPILYHLFTDRNSRWEGLMD